MGVSPHPQLVSWDCQVFLTPDSLGMALGWWSHDVFHESLFGADFDFEFLVKYPSYLKCDRNFPLFWYLFI